MRQDVDPALQRSVVVQTQQAFEKLIVQIVSEHPDTGFARRVRAAEVRYLRHSGEYVGLLPDDRSCLLEFLTWADDGRLRVFLVTKKKGLELLTFPEGSLDELQTLGDRWMDIYGNIRPREIAGIVGKTCWALHQQIFDRTVQVAVETEGGSSLVEVEETTLLDHLNTRLEKADATHPRRMFLIPHEILFLLPLHAACRNEPELERTDGKAKVCPGYVLEEYAITYAPSAYLLKQSQDRYYPESPQPLAMVVGNPQSANPKSIDTKEQLAFALTEAQTVEKALREMDWNVVALMRDQATKQRFMNGDGPGIPGIQSGHYDHLHLAQHAGFDGSQAHLNFWRTSANVPAEQYQCADREIGGAPLQRTGSVVAAACLTSMTNPKKSEYLGMGAAFLQAGVGTVIGTIYSLSDKGSSKLVPELYRLHFKEGLGWAEALRRAQLEMGGAGGAQTPATVRAGQTAEYLEQLRQAIQGTDIPEDHPYHWASFTVSGKTN